MKPWQPCKHCYLRDSYCENAEREQPCVPVQEYLESDYKIKQLQKNLEVSEKEHYKTLQQLSIATKALEETKRRIESFNEDPMNKISFMAYGTLHDCLGVAKKALKEIDVVGT